MCDPEHPSGAYDICEETCRKCADDCEDTDGEFHLGTNIRNCLWLSLRPDVQTVICVPGDPVMSICPESCDTCDGNSTLAPTPAPEPVLSTGRCDDSKLDTFLVPDLEQYQRCVWLKARPEYQETLCHVDHISQTAVVCPETCGICIDDCVDTKVRFNIGSASRDCQWLELRPTLHADLCLRPDVNDACPETCDSCDAVE